MLFEAYCIKFYAHRYTVDEREYFCLLYEDGNILWKEFRKNKKKGIVIISYSKKKKRYRKGSKKKGI